MKNKVLIKILVPELDCSFDLFVPVNEIMWKIKKMIVKSISDLTGGSLDTRKEYNFINKLTGKTYENNIILIETDIRNATEIILLSDKNNTN